jgi:acyl-CoA reductase-like NAD-dependent aldehyde dehydrogenase
VQVTNQYKVGDPMDPSTTLGPVVSLASAERIRKQVKEAGELLQAWLCFPANRAVAAGAELVLDESAFPGAKEGTTLVGPHVLVKVDHCELNTSASSIYDKPRYSLEIP